MEKINKLKKLFNYYNLDGYIVPKNDEFFGEYVPERKDKLWKILVSGGGRKNLT